MNNTSNNARTKHSSKLATLEHFQTDTMQSAIEQLYIIKNRNLITMGHC